MGKKLDHITPRLEQFINKQKMFTVGTAMKEGRINVSPKGMDSFRIINPNRIVWLNLTGSGNETATHLLHDDRMTILFSAFEGKPMILRLYGHTKVFHDRDAKFNEYLKLFPKFIGTRQIMEMEVDLVQTSCGFGIPLMEYKEDRTILNDWAEGKGAEGILAYQKQKNSISLDGHETGI